MPLVSLCRTSRRAHACKIPEGHEQQRGRSQPPCRTKCTVVAKSSRMPVPSTAARLNAAYRSNGTSHGSTSVELGATRRAVLETMATEAIDPRPRTAMKDVCYQYRGIEIRHGTSAIIRPNPTTSVTCVRLSTVVQHERRDRSERHHATSRRQRVPLGAETRVCRFTQTRRPRNGPVEIARPHEVLHRPQVACVISQEPAEQCEVEALFGKSTAADTIASRLTPLLVIASTVARAQSVSSVLGRNASRGGAPIADSAPHRARASQLPSPRALAHRPARLSGGQQA